MQFLRITQKSLPAVFLATSIIVCTLKLFGTYRANVLTVYQNTRVHFIERIVKHKFGSPYVYRKLIPWATHAMSQVFKVPVERADSWMAFGALFCSATLMAWVSFQQFKSLWAALLTLWMCYFPWSHSFINQSYQPWSYLEPAFLAAALWTLNQKKAFGFALVCCLAVLNRETAVFFSALLLPLVFGSHQRRTAWILAGVAPVLTYIFLRLVTGSAQHVHSINWILEENWKGRQESLQLLWNYYGVLWAFVLVIVFKSRSEKGFCAFFILNLVFVFIFGLWRETRMLNTLAAMVAFRAFPLLAPLGFEFKKLLWNLKSARRLSDRTV